uniref:Uncharacterized protein LOC113785505 n=1 Tax=Cicer arietinum TaxID=3827 RepID=A0A3Q7YD12_CICAR|nr:uncharacterized protein LOC113785505 [Cicer arietinum]
MINILFFFLCLVASITCHRFDDIVKDDLKIEKQIKIINKSSVKSIHTKFGYIVDCIDINKQPAFDHPLLINHKLQRKPNFQNEIQNDSVMISSTNATFGLAKDQCPIETVPIKRTTKEDLIRGKSFFNNLIFDGNPNNHVASISLRTVNPTYFSYFGVSGTNSIYNVKVENDQSSSSVMWVRNGVAPELYGDDETHLYALWMLEIDPITKDWWMTSENENLRYFPASLFSNMTSADQVGWGGRATTTSGAPGPPMGSGYFPDDIFNQIKSCYVDFIHCQTLLC